MSRTPKTVAGMLSRAARIAAPLRAEADAHDAGLWERLADEGVEAADLVVEAALRVTTGVVSTEEDDLVGLLYLKAREDEANSAVWGDLLYVKSHLSAFEIDPESVARSLRKLEDDVLPAVRRLCGLEPQSTQEEAARRGRKREGR